MEIKNFVSSFQNNKKSKGLYCCMTQTIFIKKVSPFLMEKDGGKYVKLGDSCSCLSFISVFS